MTVAFISHAHADKPVVEHYALAAAEEIGRDSVFYDSWSVQPGEGIVAGMNEALERCTHFFLFMTKTSLTSEMVRLEWQAGVFRRARDGMRLVPLRLDGSTPPALLLQLRYIDAFAHGEAAATAELRSVLRGDEVFTRNTPVENLEARAVYEPDGSATITIASRTYMEPNPSFAIFVEGTAESIQVNAPSERLFHFGHGGGVASDGRAMECVFVDKQTALVPRLPLVVQLHRQEGGQPVRVTAIAIERTPGGGEVHPADLRRTSQALGRLLSWTRSSVARAASPPAVTSFSVGHGT